MRLLTSLGTATFLTIMMYFGVLGFLELFARFSQGGGFSILGFVLLGLYAAPIAILILTIIFYAMFEEWHIKKFLYISLASFWTAQLLYWLSQLYPNFYHSENDNYLSVPLTLLFDVSSFINRFPNIFAPIFIILGCLIMRRTPSWLHLNGSNVGMIFGYALSYGLVILLRSINNSLTSYFYLDTFEIGVLVVGALIGFVIGNIVGMKFFQHKKALNP